MEETRTLPKRRRALIAVLAVGAASALLPAPAGAHVHGITPLRCVGVAEDGANPDRLCACRREKPPPVRRADSELRRQIVAGSRGRWLRHPRLSGPVAAYQAVDLPGGELTAIGWPLRGESQMISTIAVGTDGTATANEAVKQAAELARQFGAKLFLLSVFDDSAAGSDGDDVELQWASNPAARVRSILERLEEDLNLRGDQDRDQGRARRPRQGPGRSRRGVRRRPARDRQQGDAAPGPRQRPQLRHPPGELLSPGRQDHLTRAARGRSARGSRREAASAGRARA